MKYFHRNRNVSPFCLMVSVLWLTVACGIEPLSDKEQIEKTLKTDTWNISLFFNGNNETEHFHDFVFTFKENGEVDVVTNGSILSGNWEIRPSSSFRPNRLSVDFRNDPLIEISQEWRIVDYTYENIRCEQMIAKDSVLATTKKLTIVKTAI